jgi:hypothetical protein
MFIPEQFVFDMKAQKTELRNDSLYVKFKSMSAEYVAVWNADSLFYEGFWVQAGKKFSTNLKTIDKSETANFERPQTPKPPFNYISKDYRIENVKGKSTLAGTLTIPDTVGVYPLVIWLAVLGARSK